MLHTRWDQLHVSFDLDDTVATRARNSKDIPVLVRIGHVVDAILTFWIPPGMPELIALLHGKGSAISFMSSGNEERNKLLVPALLDLALPEGDARALNERVKIISVHDYGRCTDFKWGNSDQKPGGLGRREQFQMSGGNLAKNLKHVTDPELFPHSLIAEDDYTYIDWGQEKNLLYVGRFIWETASGSSYPPCICVDTEQITKKNWDETGHRPLQLSISSWRGFEQQEIQERECIAVCKVEKDGYHVGYCDNRTGAFQSTRLSPELEARVAQPPEWDTPERESLTTDLRAVVAEKGGVTTEFFTCGNQAFYMAGMIDMAMELSKTELRPISSVMFDLQFMPVGEKVEDPSQQKWMPRWKQHLTDESVYQRGLEVLRTLNPDLEFLHPQRILAICSTEPTAEQVLQEKKWKQYA